MSEHTSIPLCPVHHGPLEDVAAPKTLEDVAFQLDMLTDFYDNEYRHMEADRLLILALYMTKYEHNATAIDDVVDAYQKIRKTYV